MSLRQAAAEIGVSHAAWSAWEAGKASPLVGRLPELADLFGILPSTLIAGVDLATAAKRRRRRPPVEDESIGVLGMGPLGQRALLNMYCRTIGDLLKLNIKQIRDRRGAVSYTHLTLPTIYSV